MMPAKMGVPCTGAGGGVHDTTEPVLHLHKEAEPGGIFVRYLLSVGLVKIDCLFKWKSFVNCGFMIKLYVYHN